MQFPPVRRRALIFGSRNVADREQSAQSTRTNETRFAVLLFPRTHSHGRTRAPIRCEGSNCQKTRPVFRTTCESISTSTAGNGTVRASLFLVNHFQPGVV